MSCTRLNPTPPASGAVTVTSGSASTIGSASYGNYCGNVHFATITATTKVQLTASSNDVFATLSPTPTRTVEAVYAVSASNGQLLNAWVINGNMYVRPHTGGAALASGSTVKALVVY